MKNILIVLFLVVTTLSCGDNKAHAYSQENQQQASPNKTKSQNKRDNKAHSDSQPNEEHTSPNKTTPQNKKDNKSHADSQLNEQYTSHNKQTVQNNKAEPTNHFPLYLGIFISISISIGIFFELNKRFKNAQHELSEIKRGLESGANSRAQAKQENSKQASLNKVVETTIMRLQINIGELEQKIHDLHSRMQDLTLSTQAVFPDHNVLEDKSSEEAVVVELSVENTKMNESLILYMSTPSEDKTFPANGNFEKFKPTQTRYRFWVDQTGEKAEFDFHSDEQGIKAAINSPHLYIDRVCDIINVRPQNPTDIITHKKGTAVKIDDKWVVKEKAKVKYI